jgi:hypothetical protein
MREDHYDNRAVLPTAKHKLRRGKILGWLVVVWVVGYLALSFHHIKAFADLSKEFSPEKTARNDTSYNYHGSIYFVPHDLLERYEHAFNLQMYVLAVSALCVLGGLMVSGFWRVFSKPSAPSAS